MHNTLLALVNEGFQSLGYTPVRRGDDSDEEDDIDFRSEMYKNRPTVPMLRISDSAVQKESKRLKAEMALKRILFQGENEERTENTVRLRTEMNWVVTQLEDLLYDLKAVLERDPDEDVDKAQLRAAVLTFLESDLPPLILSM